MGWRVTTAVDVHTLLNDTGEVNVTYASPSAHLLSHANQLALPRL